MNSFTFRPLGSGRDRLRERTVKLSTRNFLKRKGMMFLGHDIRIVNDANIFYLFRTNCEANHLIFE